MLRKAKESDFRVGTVLQCPLEGWNVTLLNKYSEGIWEGRIKSGDKCIFENDAAGYWLIKLGTGTEFLGVDERKVMAQYNDIKNTGEKLNGKNECYVIVTTKNLNGSNLTYSYFCGNTEINKVGQLIDNRDGTISRVEKLVF